MTKITIVIMDKITIVITGEITIEVEEEKHIVQTLKGHDFAIGLSCHIYWSRCQWHFFSS